MAFERAIATDHSQTSIADSIKIEDFGWFKKFINIYPSPEKIFASERIRTHDQNFAKKNQTTKAIVGKS
jgi:hypothetical protein